MAYITTEEVKAIRNKLKEEFPNFKFSVRRENHIAVAVTILRSPLDLTEHFVEGRNYGSINEYYLEGKKHADELKRIVEIIKTAPATVANGREWYDKSDAQIDYFDTAFYININAGTWEKDYEQVA